MIANVNFGTSVPRMIQYIEGPGREKNPDRATIVGAQNIGFQPETAADIKLVARIMHHNGSPAMQASSTKQATKVALHMSLNWHPSQTPDQQEMMEAMQAFLKAPGMENAMAVMWRHSGKQPHGHFVANLIDPKTGLAFDRYQFLYKVKHQEIAWEIERHQITPEREYRHALARAARDLDFRRLRALMRDGGETVEPRRVENNISLGGHFGATLAHYRDEFFQAIRREPVRVPTRQEEAQPEPKPAQQPTPAEPTSTPLQIEHKPAIDISSMNWAKGGSLARVHVNPDRPATRAKRAQPEPIPKPPPNQPPTLEFETDPDGQWWLDPVADGPPRKPIQKAKEGTMTDDQKLLRDSMKDADPKRKEFVERLERAYKRDGSLTPYMRAALKPEQPGFAGVMDKSVAKAVNTVGAVFRRDSERPGRPPQHAQPEKPTFKKRVKETVDQIKDAVGKEWRLATGQPEPVPRRHAYPDPEPERPAASGKAVAKATRQATADEFFKGYDDWKYKTYKEIDLDAKQYKREGPPGDSWKRDSDEGFRPRNLQELLHSVMDKQPEPEPKTPQRGHADRGNLEDRTDQTAEGRRYIKKQKGKGMER